MAPKWAPDDEVGPPSLYGSGSIYAARVSGAAPGSLDTPYLARWTKRLQSTDMLDFFEHMPRGCRPSTLARISHEGRFDAAARLAPRANTDGIGFKDLFLDEKKPKVLRTNDVDFNLCVLFELCVALCIGNATDGSVDTGETSCGWGVLPLYAADGSPVEKKTYDVKLYGGTPYESDVELGGPVGKRGIWETLTNANRTPMLSIRLWSLGKSAMKRIKCGFCAALADLRTGNLSRERSLLPETLITFLAYVPALAYYRQLQADAILVGKDEEPDLQVKCSPALAVLERIVDQWDLMRELIITWDLESRKIRRRDRVREERMPHVSALGRMRGG
ncbi:MAG: hypothetical protein BJ554DRAFT_24 [Olpidium bornovanus]|uniref:Uncharacterized protein n=1 Tax=Olpidium bornovanus TaxID=278681 RepID=A0A8H7ZUT9_9FUNG|nr:MAG: hypothetical protein BJ554DRAFT_24 [Olpidium bornovanus]